MAEKLTPYLNSLIEKSGGSLVVEAGHFYAEKGVDEEVLAGVQTAASLLQLAISFFNIKPDQMVLVDDIGVAIQPFMVQAAVANFIRFGFEQNNVVYESGLVSDGNVAIANLKAKRLTKEHKGRERLKKGWIPLQGKAGIAEHPACEVLDAVLYQRKLNQWGGAITVLPQGYQEQQQKTKIIFQAITDIQMPNALVVYHDKQAEVTEIDYWGENEKS